MYLWVPLHLHGLINLPQSSETYVTVVERNAAGRPRFDTVTIGVTSSRQSRHDRMGYVQFESGEGCVVDAMMLVGVLSVIHKLTEKETFNLRQRK